MPQSQTTPDTLTASQSDLARVWKVIVLNDPVNLMSYVVLVFRKVFGFDEVKARKHMLEVHEEGRSVLWAGEREIAENYVHRLHQWQLRAYLENDEKN